MRANNESHDRKKNYIESLVESTKHKHTKIGLDKEDNGNPVPASIQMQYPMLKPVVFTNIVEDDMISGYVWQHRN